jgi:phosphatidate phosphatase PAH1
VPHEELKFFKITLLQILQLLKKQSGHIPAALTDYITAAEFMKAVGIKKTKFFNLKAKGKVATIKRCRKIYVHIQEIDTYFKNSSI